MLPLGGQMFLIINYQMNSLLTPYIGHNTIILEICT